MDSLTKERRSWNMSRIRGSDTKPEQRVRSALHRLGFRFRKETGRTLLGKPDVVLPRHRTVVFVHGCFWHRHRGCKFAYTPKSRVDFWQTKFDENVSRDRRVSRVLRAEGWNVVVVWECQTIDPERLATVLSKHIPHSGLRHARSSTITEVRHAGRRTTSGIHLPGRDTGGGHRVRP